jgi:hypothetical protein
MFTVLIVFGFKRFYGCKNSFEQFKFPEKGSGATGGKGLLDCLFSGTKNNENGMGYHRPIFTDGIIIRWSSGLKNVSFPR